jgi:hypothetical protein
MIRQNKSAPTYIYAEKHPFVPEKQRPDLRYGWIEGAHIL